MHNVEVALELKINQTNTSITTIKSRSAKIMGVRAAWHQRSSWAQPSVSGDHQAVMLSSGLILQNHDFSRQSPWIQPVRCRLVSFCACHALFVLALSRGASLSISFYFLLPAKPCSSATSVLNEFFNISQNFVDHWMPLHYFFSTPETLH